MHLALQLHLAAVDQGVDPQVLGAFFVENVGHRQHMQLVLGIFGQSPQPQRPNPARRGADTEDFDLLLLLRHDGASFL